MSTQLFEPSVELQIPYLPYKDWQILGVWPRKHQVPTDIFPTLTHIAGRNPAGTEARAAFVTDDNELMVTSGANGGPAVTDSFHDTFETSADNEYSFDLGLVPKIVLLFNGGIQYLSYNDNTPPQHVRFWLQGSDSGKQLDLGIIPNNYDGSPVNGFPFMIQNPMPSGLNLTRFFDNDTDVSVQIESNNVFGTISWVLLCQS